MGGGGLGRPKVLTFSNIVTSTVVLCLTRGPFNARIRLTGGFPCLPFSRHNKKLPLTSATVQITRGFDVSI